MSFECNPCHVAATGKDMNDVHLSLSYGRCETCGTADTCADCQCPIVVTTFPGGAAAQQVADLRALREELLTE
jgi:hypothetical protein